MLNPTQATAQTPSDDSKLRVMRDQLRKVRAEREALHQHILGLAGRRAPSRPAARWPWALSSLSVIVAAFSLWISLPAPIPAPGVSSEATISAPAEEPALEEVMDEPLPVAPAEELAAVEATAPTIEATAPAVEPAATPARVRVRTRRAPRRAPATTASEDPFGLGGIGAHEDGDEVPLSDDFLDQHAL